MDTNAQGGRTRGKAETIHRRTAPRSAFNWIVRGRSPGSEVLLAAFPGISQWHDGKPHFLTVAGAAQASSNNMSDSPVSRFTRAFENTQGTADEAGGL
jgi:hypothetical protein